MAQPLPIRAARWGLPATIALYLVLGTLYAVCTPAWQAPDEPAHYNYVRSLAERHAFPVLLPGDYPAAYLEEIKAARFPPEMSIAPIRYEFHQPPLYYLLAAPVYSLFGGALLPLRLLSVVLGALLLLVVSWAVREVAPGRPALVLGATAFVAFLPMHLAMTAAVNNDTLAELLLALALLLAIRLLKRTTVPPDARADRRLLVLLGIVAGLGFLTKTSAYIAPLLALAALAARHIWLDPDPPSWKATLGAALCALLPAALLGMPWWLRNWAQYGGLDLLGLGRHAQVVAGQLRTSEFVAQYGAGRLAHDLAFTTFRSFWGQFGWMGVLLDRRLYQGLALLSVLALVGLVVWWLRARRIGRAKRLPIARQRVPDRALPAWQWAAAALLALSALLTLASYLWYNADFLQHQGRYLFPALLPIALGVSLGWHEALRRKRAFLLAAISLLAMPALFLAGVRDTWLLVLLAGTSGAFALRRFLPARWEGLLQGVPYLLLPLLDLVCLFLFVVPQLRP